MAASFHALPPDITSFVGWNERNKVGVRDMAGERKENDLPKFTSNVVILEMRALQ